MKKSEEELIPTRWTLIERLKDWDDQESWRDFFNTYWELIYGVAIQSGLSHTEAQDVVQETIISVSKNMKSFRADPAAGSFKSWLLNLTRWRITDRVRRRGKEFLSAGQDPAPGAESSRTAAEERFPDPSLSALEKIWNEEWDRRLIEVALKKVKLQADARHYQAFYLNAIKQVPPATVAEIVGLSVDQVYLVKHRLMKLFEEALQDPGTTIG